MPELRERLSSVLKATERVLRTVAEDELSALRAAFASSLRATGESRTLEDGTKVPSVEVDLSTLVTAAKPGSDAAMALRDLFRSVLSEVAYRGENWAKEALHLALKEHVPSLVAPPQNAPAPAAAAAK